MERKITVNGTEKSGFYITIDSYILGSRSNARIWKTRKGAEKFIEKIKNGTASFRLF